MRPKDVLDQVTACGIWHWMVLMSSITGADPWRAHLEAKSSTDGSSRAEYELHGLSDWLEVLGTWVIAFAALLESSRAPALLKRHVLNGSL